MRKLKKARSRRNISLKMSCNPFQQHLKFSMTLNTKLHFDAIFQKLETISHFKWKRLMTFTSFTTLVHQRLAYFKACRSKRKLTPVHFEGKHRKTSFQLCLFQVVLACLVWDFIFLDSFKVSGLVKASVAWNILMMR